MGILLGLGAALGWGVGDFFATGAARRFGAVRAQAWTQTLCFLALIGLLAWRGETWSQTTAAWRSGLMLGAVHCGATWCLYRAFEIGTLSIVAPLASSYVILTAVLARWSGERASPLALLGALLLFVGVVFITRTNHDKPGNRRGWLEAGGAAIGFAIVFWGLDDLTRNTSALWPLLPLRGCNIIGALLVLKLAPTSDDSPRSRQMGMLNIALVALCDSFAWVCFTTGLNSASTTILTALSSLFSAVTVLMAWIFLRERLAPWQWAGVVVILLGVLCVAF